MKKRRFQMLLRPEEFEILNAKAKARGFTSKGEYIRHILFVELTLADKIDELYQKIIQDGRPHH